MSIRRYFPLMAVVAALAMVAVTANVARADQRDFTLINATGTTISELYVGPSDDTEDWGEDILGVDTLAPGESVNIIFSRFDGDAGTCLYDIKIVTEEGDEGILLEVDLCNTFTVTFR